MSRDEEPMWLTPSPEGLAARKRRREYHKVVLDLDLGLLAGKKPFYVAGKFNCHRAVVSLCHTNNEIGVAGYWISLHSFAVD